MPGHVHHVVDAPEHPDVAVGVISGTVAREVPALLSEPRPIDLAVALGIAPDAPQHRRPRLIEHQIAGDMLGIISVGNQFVAVIVDDLRRNSR